MALNSLRTVRVAGFGPAWAIGAMLLASPGTEPAKEIVPPPRSPEFFETRVAPLLERRCVSCHNESKRKGGLALDTRAGLDAGAEGDAVVVRGRPEASSLIAAVSGDDPAMPRLGPKLDPAEVARLREWIAAGAPWPAGRRLAAKLDADLDWWSLRPIARPHVPLVADGDPAPGVRTPIDAFVIAQLEKNGLRLSPEADRRTLIRRLTYDLHGLPPSPEEVEAFVRDDRPDAYDRLVDRLLASPAYGERWARHWLDVVHYADTHGYDKDKLRPNAWPYRDYVIRALNEDKPYSRFVEEQIAGDVLYPGTRDGIVATGFIAAGPWDFIGHAEVPESKIDGKIARNLDRDDMVTTTMQTFVSTTVQCARCHDHKFDPVTQEDYYSLQAVFAALDRADRPYERSDEVGTKRKQLTARRDELVRSRERLLAETRQRAGPELERVERELATLEQTTKPAEPRPEFGYHSAIEARQDVEKWVQVDLGAPVEIERVIYAGCHDDFAGIGAGFGFPVRYRIAVSNDEDFAEDVHVLIDSTDADAPNPGVTPQLASGGGRTARYVRVTATKLAHRQRDYIFALAELSVVTTDGRNAARGGKVTALDSIEAPVRWSKKNLVDGYYRGGRANAADLAKIERLLGERERILSSAQGEVTRRELAAIASEIDAIDRNLKALPAPGRVYAGTIHTGSGAFQGTGSAGGAPREIRVLHRGDVQSPGALVDPGVPPLLAAATHRFALPKEHPEGERRRELAAWITRRDNVLTWRSIVNRVWQYHFGRGIVETANDFGRMGEQPSHPELLDWLAAWFRDDGGQSLKALHRLILRSAVYRQQSVDRPEASAVDAGNRLLWRMQRRRLEAEAVRDTALLLAGRLGRRIGGPGFRAFILEKPEHSPHYEYAKHSPSDPASHRRTIYRFIVRSQQDPLMTTLDCADPSLMVDRRNETLTAIQALALLNNRFVTYAAEEFAARLASEETLEAKIRRAVWLALSRKPSREDAELLLDHAKRFGLANACRVLLNLNEFLFVD